jgi:two-component system chemotaxis response regulator CheB/chemosensory pili system protein ChpB (putative protein-glutamate methylesterase)
VNVSSNEPGVAIALLYETREGGEHLREIMNSIGAPVVYEAHASALDRDALERSQANVVVVNLDARNDPDLGGVYSLLDDTRYRVVFNEGEVSSALSGSDRARWLRHLAAKVLGADVDPPRPVGAEPVPTRKALPAQPVRAHEDQVPASGPTTTTVTASAVQMATKADVTPAHSFAGDAETPISDFDVGAVDLIDFDAMIEMPEVAPGFPANAATDDELVPEPPLPTLSDAFEIGFDDDVGDFAANSPGNHARADGDTGLTLDFPDVPTARTPYEPAQDLDLDFDLDFDLAAQPVAPSAVASAPAPESSPLDQGGALEWSLEDVFDETDSPSAPAVAPGAAEFGIEKLRAEEFLAPQGGAAVEQDFESPLGGLALELIPLEEAVAPSAPALDHENWLDPDAVVVPKAKVRRVWVLGASIGGPEAVREFLAGLPRDYPALFLLAQHLGDEFVGMMTNQLTQATKLTVRTPTHGERVGHGDIVVVPNSHRLQVDAEGVVVLERNAGTTAFSPSIDRVLRDIADKFGDCAGAIIFSGMSSDAAEGSRYLAEKGGLIYAQRPDTCVVSSMIDGVCETGVVSFLGSPQELAEKLLETKA